jgi:membrane-associated phospholipid phosphatase
MLKQTSAISQKLTILGLLAFLMVLISIFFLDQGATQLLSEEQANQSYRVTRTLTDAGEAGPYFAIAILCSLGAWAYLKHNKTMSPALAIKLEEVRKWGLTFLYALIGSGLVVHLIKFVVGRARPNRSDSRSPWDFEFFTHNWHNHSFPSGHSQTLFTAAVALSFVWPKYSKLFFVLAGLLAFTRILLNQHFLSDVIMGSYIGYAVSLMIFSRAYFSSTPRLKAE